MVELLTIQPELRLITSSTLSVYLDWLESLELVFNRNRGLYLCCRDLR